MQPNDNEANMHIIGSNETNRQYDQVHDNRSMQLPKMSLEERIRLGIAKFEDALNARVFTLISRR